MPDDGAIVTVSSTAAKTGAIPEVAVYAAAKAGVLSLTRSFASAHAARGMRVNCVLPGIIDTPMQRRFLELNAPLRGMTPDELHAERLAATPDASRGHARGGGRGHPVPAVGTLVVPDRAVHQCRGRLRHVVSTMRVMELPGVDQALRLARPTRPGPGPGEVRLRVEACGVCGSDHFLQAGGFGPGVAFPVVPGHEAAGRVDAVGDGVDGWSVGDQAAIYYLTTPAGDPWAAAGRPNISPGSRAWAWTSTAPSRST